MSGSPPQRQRTQSATPGEVQLLVHSLQSGVHELEVAYERLLRHIQNVVRLA
jgi:hypothetical protein